MQRTNKIFPGIEVKSDTRFYISYDNKWLVCFCEVFEYRSFHYASTFKIYDLDNLPKIMFDSQETLFELVGNEPCIYLEKSRLFCFYNLVFYRKNTLELVLVLIDPFHQVFSIIYEGNGILKELSKGKGKLEFCQRNNYFPKDSLVNDPIVKFDSLKWLPIGDMDSIFAIPDGLF